jgi:hypothetical protein
LKGRSEPGASSSACALAFSLRIHCSISAACESLILLKEFSTWSRLKITSFFASRVLSFLICQAAKVQLDLHTNS